MPDTTKERLARVEQSLLDIKLNLTNHLTTHGKREIAMMVALLSLCGGLVLMIIQNFYRA